MPEKPTRRDFASHEPDQRVGQRGMSKPRKAKSEVKTESGHPNKQPPVAETPQDIPDDIGNR
jgi:hypothetical protein